MPQLHDVVLNYVALFKRTEVTMYENKTLSKDGKAEVNFDTTRTETMQPLGRL